MECNGDQGYTLKTILEDPTAKSYGIWGHEYRETQNKQIKISTYLYDKWHHIQWDEKSDLDYMNQVLDTDRDGKAHDDAPECNIKRSITSGNPARVVYCLSYISSLSRNNCIKDRLAHVNSVHTFHKTFSAEPSVCCQ